MPYSVLRMHTTHAGNTDCHHDLPVRARLPRPIFFLIAIHTYSSIPARCGEPVIFTTFKHGLGLSSSTYYWYYVHTRTHIHTLTHIRVCMSTYLQVITEDISRGFEGSASRSLPIAASSPGIPTTTYVCCSRSRTVGSSVRAKGLTGSLHGLVGAAALARRKTQNAAGLARDGRSGSLD
jgi:hypothetical protein